MKTRLDRRTTGSYAQAMARRIRQRIEEARRLDQRPSALMRQHLSVLSELEAYLTTLAPDDPLLVLRQQIEIQAGRPPTGYEPGGHELAVISDVGKLTGATFHENVEAPNPRPTPREVLEHLLVEAAFDTQKVLAAQRASVLEAQSARDEAKREFAKRDGEGERYEAQLREAHDALTLAEVRAKEAEERAEYWEREARGRQEETPPAAPKQRAKAGA